MAHGRLRQRSPGFADDLLLFDSTPVPCAASRETVKRSALGEVAGYGYCAAHSRWFWGFRLHLLAAPDGTPRAFTLADPGRGEREVALELLERCSARRRVLVCDKGYAGREFAARPPSSASRRAPGAQGRAGPGPHLAPIRQRIESIFWTCKDLLTLERHGARTLAGLRERILQRFSAWPPASASTTGWGGPAALWSTTAPEAVGVESII